MTNTIRKNGFNFDRVLVDAMTDQLYDVILDRFDSALGDITSNAIGEQGPNETEDQLADRYHAAHNALIEAILENLIKTLA